MREAGAMLSYGARRHLPYPQHQLFDVAADIEKYPEFLPWFAAVRILRREDNRLEVEQLMRFRLVNARFLTTAQLEPPRRIDIRSGAGPFRSFHESWVFEEAAGGGTEVEFSLEASLRSRVMEGLAAFFLDQRTIPADVIARFERRVHELYRASAGAGRGRRARA